MAKRVRVDKYYCWTELVEKKNILNTHKTSVWKLDQSGLDPIVRKKITSGNEDTVLTETCQAGRRFIGESGCRSEIQGTLGGSRDGGL